MLIGAGFKAILQKMVTDFDHAKAGAKIIRQIADKKRTRRLAVWQWQL